MVNDSDLDTGVEYHYSHFPPSTASVCIPRDPTPGGVPSRTPSFSDTQTSTTSSHMLPISELVLDDDITSKPPPSACLLNSKHNPDFRVRNHTKVVELSTIISGFQHLLQYARRAKDQSALDCLYAHVLKAGEGLDSFAQSSLVPQADNRPESDDQSFCEVIRADKENEWYMVQHDSLDVGSSEYDVLATKRLRDARKAYEAKLDEVSSDPESDSGAYIYEEQHSEDQENTLVDDSPDDFALMHTASSVNLDGSHPKAAPEPMVIEYPDYLCPEVLQRAADFLATIQRGNVYVINTHGITLADLNIAEDETSVSETLVDLRNESFRAIIDLTEKLRRETR